MVLEAIPSDFPIYAQPSTFRQCAPVNGAGTFEKSLLKSEKLSAVDGFSQNDQNRLERVYDVAYSEGLLSLSLSLPGTIAGMDRCDSTYSTMFHQLLKPVNAPERAKRHADQRRSRTIHSMRSNRLSEQFSSDLGPLESSCYNYLGYQKYQRDRQSGTRRYPIISISLLSLSIDTRKGWERLLLRMPRRRDFLRNISFSLSGGDIMAVMYASETEAQALLDVLSGKSVMCGRVTGEFSINGHHLKNQQFASRTVGQGCSNILTREGPEVEVAIRNEIHMVRRVFGRRSRTCIANLQNDSLRGVMEDFEKTMLLYAHVTSDFLPQALTVVEYLRISAAFHPPATRAFKIENMIDQLVATLALAHQRHTPCCRLKKAELVRLKIAAELLKDTDILICDNVMKHMDIYEMAFVLDYLRDWAIKLNRIVIVAIAPRSFEILLMFSQCALLTSGQIVYFGCPTKMVQYFTSIDFPCPKFKNPCDFYVDLATQDHQSAAASAESSARIAKLIQCWESLKPIPPEVTKCTVSPMLTRPSMIDTIEALFRRNWYEFTNRPLTSLHEPLMALLMSCIIGVAFISLTREKRAAVSDRIGLIMALSYFGLIPWIFVVIRKADEHKRTVLEMVRRSGVSTFLFINLEFLWDLPLLIVTAACYSFPVPFLAVLNISSSSQLLWLLSFFIIIFIHLLLWRMLSKALVFVCPNPGSAFFGIVALLTLSHLTSGLVVHPKEKHSVVFQSHWLSPHRWISQALLESEYLGTSMMEAVSGISSNDSELTIGCERKEVLARMILDIPIYTISQCSTTRGSQLLYFHGFTKPFITNRFLSPQFFFGCSIMTSWILIAFLMLICTVRCAHVSI